MRLRVGDFDKFSYDNKVRIVIIKGISVITIKLAEDKSLVLYSVYNFFVEAVVDTRLRTIVSMERLTLDQVIDTYCEDITSI